ncbi:MAG: S1 RNA-binding domain-containing protein [Acidobacteriota bacterium]
MSNDGNEEDFATMFAASVQTKRLQNGQSVEGTIVAIGADSAFINVGAKGEATIALEELRTDEGVIEAEVGDRIQATVVSTTGGITLSRKLQRGAATARQLEDAFRSGLPVEGKVEGQVKAGYNVTIAGKRAFCPMSQIDIIRDTDPAAHDGRVYTFKIVEYKDGGQKFVVSRRALQEEEQRARAVEVRQSIAPGAILAGRVVSVRDFGAFVDLGGGVQGLLHVSEMGWSRVTDAAQVVTPGQEITVKVLRVDADKIALGMKQLMADPWSAVPATYEVGQVRQGRISRVAEFGAFVELEPGIEGLAHSSTFAPTGRPGGWAKTVSVGMTGAFEILSIDLEKKRIGVARVEEGSSRASAATPSRSAIVPGARLTGKVERHEPFGVFVFLAPGIVGLVPASETGVSRDADMVKAFPLGAEVEVVVLEVDAASRRIRLSIKAVKAAEEAAEVRDYAERADAQASASFGSLADKLRGALGTRG